MEDVQETKQNESLAELISAGVHIGHRPSRRHPKMQPYIFGRRGTVEVIDVTKTQETLEQTLPRIREESLKNGMILFVGTKPHLAGPTEEAAKSCAMPYVTNRWIGGTITNFAVISKRLASFREKEREIKSEEFNRYTKAERVKKIRLVEKLQKELGGIRDVAKLPSLLVLASLRSDMLAAREARMKGIPTIAIVDTNADPTLVNYAIPGNDDAASAVRIILMKIAEAITTNRPAEEPKAPEKP